MMAMLCSMNYMSVPMSPHRLAKARDLYNIFNVFNSFSYTMLAGGIVTLFAMRLKANSTFIGLLSAVGYVAFFFLPLGKILTRTFSVVKIYSITWVLRAVAMTPFFLAPFFASAGNTEFALNLTLIGVLLFHVSRGIGMIGNNPVLNDLSAGPDRASYMTQIQVINSAVGMVSNFAIAILLGGNPPLFLYAVIIGSGIIGGVTSGIMLRNIPEPHGDKNKKNAAFFSILKECFGRKSFKQFIVLLILIAMASGVARAFVIVYCREIFDQSDGMIALYTVFGGLGSMLIGMLIKFLIDRVGAKPLFMWCTIVGLISMLPIIFFPTVALDNFITVILFLAFLNFMLNFGFIGAEGLAQTYFLSLIPAEYMLDMGIVYFFCFGIAGAGGSFLAGTFLDFCTGINVAPTLSFKMLYAVLAAMVGVVLILQRSLVLLGALPFKNALDVMFSFRDLHAINLLERLNKTSDSQEEEALLEALHDTPSQLAIQGLLTRAHSPLLSVRFEALRALEMVGVLNTDAEKMLLDDVINNAYTTAFISARILGNHKVSAAIPILRELSLSRDYMLAAESVIALAKLGDNAFRPQIERLILGTENFRLKIMGIEALGLYRSPESLGALLDILRNAGDVSYLSNEVALALASILGIKSQFYHLLVRFLEDQSLGETLALDEAETAVEFFTATHGGWKPFRKKSHLAAISAQAKTLQDAVSSYMHDSNGAPFSQWIFALPESVCEPIAQSVFAEVVLDDELGSIIRLRLLVCQWAAQCLHLWTQDIGRHHPKQPLLPAPVGSE
ncbi:MFS transporter [Spirochaetia bacterium]|nr:MFS transporter [Spirochaetia bacterium]GHU30727.1 MFS transporter [Spirochaetia bacterium]